MNEKGKSLIRKSLTQFIICVILLMLLAMPLFYWLTKSFYAEDMADIIEAVQQGKPIPALDLEEDIMHGIMIQFALIVFVLGIAIILTMRFISKRLWKPFDQTLSVIETFKLEDGVVPIMPKSDIVEFQRLTNALGKLMEESLKSYRLQKEFTENASHELQTPLAVFQGKLDLLLQQPEINESQAKIIQDLYQTTNRLSHLSRNLLLLAKIENSQFSRTESVDVVRIVDEAIPLLENLSVSFHKDFAIEKLIISANRSLLESLVNNLIVNAVRHNIPDGEIFVHITHNMLTVSNTSNDEKLDEHFIFNRFYRPSEKVKGNGLGLAIVKAICDYHGWDIKYEYNSGVHNFTVTF